MAKKILDIGCADIKLGGKDEFPNYSFEGEVIGLDYIKSKEADIVCDLNTQKIPAKDNTFDIVYAHHSLEHIKNAINAISESHRVLKKGGRLLIRVPHLCSIGSFSELTHVTRFSWTTLDCFISNKTKHSAQYDYQLKEKAFFKLIKRKMVFRKTYVLLGIQCFANKFPHIFEGFFGWIFQPREMHWELEKI